MAELLHRLKVEYRSITSLKSYPRNPRTHSAKQIRQIAESIKRFGFTNPILMDANGSIIAGHGRVEAARLLGIERVPTIRLDRMSEAEQRAYIIADNKLAENAGWDRELLVLELQYVAELDIDFDLTIIGFDTGEIDLLIQDADESRRHDLADQIPERGEPGPPVTRGRSVGPGRPPPTVCRCDPSGVVRPTSRTGSGAAGYYRPAVQRSDRWTCLRSRRDPASGICDGGG